VTILLMQENSFFISVALSETVRREQLKIPLNI